MWKECKKGKQYNRIEKYTRRITQCRNKNIFSPNKMEWVHLDRQVYLILLLANSA